MPVAAIGAGIGGIGSLIGGIKGSNAASNAGQLQYQAAQQGIQQIQQALAQVNPPIQTAANLAGTNAVNAAQQTGQYAINTASGAGGNVVNAAQAANTLLNPYLQTGNQATNTLASMMAPGGQLVTPFTASNMAQYNPGYQFTINEANKALQASAAGRGAALGGGAASQLNAQTMQLANQQYTQGLQNYLAQNQQLYGMLSGQAQQGQLAAGLSGNNLLNAYTTAGGWNTGAANTAGNWMNQGTQFAGTLGTNAAQQIAANTLAGTGQMTNLLTGGAAAQAAGQIGAANAWSGALGGFGNAVNQGISNYTLYKLMQTLAQNQPVKV